MPNGIGGGICAHGLIAKYSTISDNIVYDGVGGQSVGGGAVAYGAMGIYHSTVDHNTSATGSALVARSSMNISNSTISSNHGSTSTIFIHASPAVFEIANSTIAQNQLGTGGAIGAVYLNAQDTDTLSLFSTIIAKNTAGNVGADLYVRQGHGTIAGADNLVIASNVALPAGVVTVISDPKLGPLQFNGGRVRTHELLPGSPAIGKGNHVASFPPYDGNVYDGRGAGYPRTSGASGTSDIGAVEFDRIFVSDLDVTL
jgi:hypothetical protein